MVVKILNLDVVLMGTQQQEKTIKDVLLLKLWMDAKIQLMDVVETYKLLLSDHLKEDAQLTAILQNMVVV